MPVILTPFPSMHWIGGFEAWSYRDQDQKAKDKLGPIGITRNLEYVRCSGTCLTSTGAKTEKYKKEKTKTQTQTNKNCAWNTRVKESNVINLNLSSNPARKIGEKIVIICMWYFISTLFKR